MSNSVIFARVAKAIMGICIALPSSAIAASSCDALFGSSAKSVSAIGWRAGVSHADSRGGIAPTSAYREHWIRNSKRAMEDFMYSEVDTPEMVFASAEGVVTRVTEFSLSKRGENPIPLNYTKNQSEQGFHTENVPTITVSGLGPSGILRGTLLLPVSGHRGIDKAQAWSKTDTYSVTLETDLKAHALSPKGSMNATAAPLVLARDVKSLDVTTYQEVAFELTPNRPSYLKYYRQGSGGPAGYMDGRVIEVIWDGK